MSEPFWIYVTDYRTGHELMLNANQIVIMRKANHSDILNFSDEEASKHTVLLLPSFGALLIKESIKKLKEDYF